MTPEEKKAELRRRGIIKGNAGKTGDGKKETIKERIARLKKEGRI